MENFINTFIQADAISGLKQLPDESIDCIITSPPYWGLRDYGTEKCIWGGDSHCNHRFDIQDRVMHSGSTNSNMNVQKKFTDFKSKQGYCQCGAWYGELGHEPTSSEYISHLVMVFKEAKRVLKKTGTMFVNLGDTYSGSGNGIGTKPGGNKGHKYTAQNKTVKAGKTNLPNKCQANIPARFAIAMTDELGLRQRNKLIWYKPNAMPSSAKDRFTVDFEEIFFFTKSEKYYFKPLREMMKQESRERMTRGVSESHQYMVGSKGVQTLVNPRKNGEIQIDDTPLERNKRCVWEIPTQPFSEAHYAVFPEILVEPMIESGCPVEVHQEYGKGTKPGVVLDMFMGSGTVAKVALRMGVNFVGIELNEKNIEICNRRVESLLHQGNIFSNK